MDDERRKLETWMREKGGESNARIGRAGGGKQKVVFSFFLWGDCFFF